MFWRRKSSPKSSPVTPSVGEESRYLSSWDTGLVFSSNGRCPYLKEYTVYVPESLEKLAEEGRSITTEFMLYAKSVELDDKIIILPRYCIPKQKASTAFVEALDNSCKDYNVVIHKHPDGVKHFSDTDDESINANNKVSILLEGGRIADVVVKQKLPCGAYIAVKADAKIYLPVNISEEKVIINDADVDALIKEIRGKLVEEKPRYSAAIYYSYYPTYDYYRTKHETKDDEEDDDWYDWSQEPPV